MAAPLSGELATLVQGAADYASKDVAASSRSGYLRDFRRFETWAAEHGLPSLPTSPEIVSTYLAALALGRVHVRWIGKGGKARETCSAKKMNTLRRAYSAITYYQREAGIDWPRAHPAVVRVMKGIAREFADDPSKRVRQVDPLELAALSKCIATLGDDMRGLRDKVMLLVGFFACLRRSELAALDVDRIRWTTEGAIITIGKSKTDQAGKGERVAIERQARPELCAVTAMRQWLDAIGGPTSGPLVRAVSKSGRVLDRRLSPGSIAALVKQIVEDAKLDPRVFSGHSMRAGLATEAGKQKKSLDATMRQGRWKSERQCMQYMRHGSLFTDNATSGLVT